MPGVDFARGDEPLGGLCEPYCCAVSMIVSVVTMLHMLRRAHVSAPFVGSRAEVPARRSGRFASPVSVVDTSTVTDMRGVVGGAT